MKLNYKNAEKGVKSGKYFDISLVGGDIKIKLRMLDPKELNDLTEMGKNVPSYKQDQEFFKTAVVGWEGFENEEGKEIKFDPKLLESEIFCQCFAELRLKEPVKFGENPVKSLGTYLFYLSSSSVLYLSGGQESFL